MEQKKFTNIQKEILVGKMLGDSWMETTTGVGWRLRIEQSINFRNYVEHVKEIFKDWLTEKTINSPLYVHKNHGRGDDCVTFNTITHVAFRFYGQQIHTIDKESKKLIRKVSPIIHRLLTPRAIAYWYMDDGSIKSQHHKAVRFNTQRYTEKDVDLLISVLRNKFQIESRRLKTRQIETSGYSYETLSELIFPYLLPEFHYKFPEPRKSDWIEKENLTKLHKE